MSEAVSNNDAREAKTEIVEVSTVADMIKGAVEPFAESQRIAAVEGTKQTEIIVKAKTKMFLGICGLVTLIIIIAGIALFLEKDQITEKIIIAIVSFLGGMGF
ncbi:hypothetical protein SAMN05660420_03364 [Desulfuromusa kysingii]|uniref:Uncharacterized protein n=1 Tax=Desulfuromusa kysingii TaxID=37625 RepID=A0A1H4EFK3_9BACT|nr:hypothetical protein [Desulfuromusa kysingii]SEA83835.1 hypothetical protein SAMN05660420_03364 [Desulfuromusa kysingii]